MNINNIDLLQTVVLNNKKGMQLKLTNYGATIMSLKVPNKDNVPTDVIVGFEMVEDYFSQKYKENPLYLGSSIGRYAGRISNGNFTVNNQIYTIENDNGVHLHGGNQGFDAVIWSFDTVTDSSCTMTYMSPDLEEGYPGNLAVKVLFELNDANDLKITYTATTDCATPVNLTSHPYFNLNGKGSILSHKLRIDSNAYLDVDAQLLPSGKINQSEKTRFDRKTESKLGRLDFEGFDDTFILNDSEIKASLTSVESGIILNVFSNQKAMVVYTPKVFPDLPFTKDFSGVVFPAICFEPQNFPDAPNKAHFPNSILEPGQQYNNQIVYAFSVL